MPYTCFRARVIPPVKLSLNLGELFGFFLLSVSSLLFGGILDMSDERDALRFGSGKSMLDIASTFSGRPVELRRPKETLGKRSVARKAVEKSTEREVGFAVVVIV